MKRVVGQFVATANGEKTSKLKLITKRATCKAKGHVPMLPNYDKNKGVFFAKTTL